VHGDLAEAETVAEQALQIGTDAAQRDAFMIYGAQLTAIRVFQGRGEEILELMEEAVEANPGIPAWRGGLAQVHGWLGRTRDAGAIVEEAARDGFDHLPWDQARTTALALYADAASCAGVNDAAAILYELTEPWKDQLVWNGASGYGHVRTYLGLLAATLGWDERADEHFGLACDVQEQKGMLLWAARAHLGWAEALAARGESERTRAEAARALQLSREQGYALIEPRAAALAETGAAATR
jgi:hypothetical protein